jgi:hypothetical protein
MDVIALLFLFFVALGITVAVIQWVVEQLGKAIGFLAKFAIPAFTIFVAFSAMSAGAAEASVLAVPAGAVVGAVVQSSLGV